jgi:hypothetical protein
MPNNSSQDRWAPSLDASFPVERRRAEIVCLSVGDLISPFSFYIPIEDECLPTAWPSSSFFLAKAGVGAKTLCSPAYAEAISHLYCYLGLFRPNQVELHLPSWVTPHAITLIYYDKQVTLQLTSAQITSSVHFQEVVYPFSADIQTPVTAIILSASLALEEEHALPPDGRPAPIPERRVQPTGSKKPVSRKRGNS